MPLGTRMNARRGGHHARPVGGGRGAASQAAAGMEHAQQVPSFAIPLGGHFQAIQAMVNGTAAIPVGGRMVRVNQEQTDQVCFVEPRDLLCTVSACFCFGA